MANGNTADATGAVATPDTSPDFVWPIAMEKRMKIGYLAELLEETHEDVAARADDLTAFASKLRSGIGCQLAPRLMNTGGSWVVRLLVFDDGVRWVARLALYPHRRRKVYALQSEVDTIKLLKERGLPVPKLYGYDLTANTIGRPFMLMEYLPYNSEIDVRAACEKHPTLYPLKEVVERDDWPDSFLRSLAEFQVRLSSIRLPGTGHVTNGEDGGLVVSPGYRQSAVHTSTRSYLEDWIDHGLSVPREYARFYNTSQAWADKSLQALRDFPSVLEKIAATFADNGDEQAAGFPMTHFNLSYQDVLVDSDLNVVAVVDWTRAETKPWALVTFPEVLGSKRPYLKGTEEPAGTIHRYIGFVKEAEEALGTDHKLSSALENLKYQNLSEAMDEFSHQVGPDIERLKALFLDS